MIGDMIRSDIEALAVRTLESGPLMERARAGQVTPSAVAAYLVSIKHVIRYTPVFLRRAHELSVARGFDDFAQFYAQKLADEEGHDQWAESDVSVMRSRFELSTSFEPMPSSLELVAYLKTAIERDPRCYISYVLLAEYFTVLVGPELVSTLEQRCRVPSSALSVVANHVELDKAHAAHGFSELDELVSDSSLFEPLVDTLHCSIGYIERFFSEVATFGSSEVADVRAFA